MLLIRICGYTPPSLLLSQREKRTYALTGKNIFYIGTIGETCITGKLASREAADIPGPFIDLQIGYALKQLSRYVSETLDFSCSLTIIFSVGRGSSEQLTAGLLVFRVRPVGHLSRHDLKISTPKRRDRAGIEPAPIHDGKFNAVSAKAHNENKKALAAQGKPELTNVLEELNVLEYVGDVIIVLRETDSRCSLSIYTN